MKTWGKDIQGDKMATAKTLREGTNLVFDEQKGLCDQGRRSKKDVGKR